MGLLLGRGCDMAITAKVLVIAGGGGGGNNIGGGGGAGGYLYNSSFSIDPNTYTVTVGTGGPGATASDGVGTAGNNSVFSSLTSVGGGGGSGYNGGGAGAGGEAGGTAARCGDAACGDTDQEGDGVPPLEYFLSAQIMQMAAVCPRINTHGGNLKPADPHCESYLRESVQSADQSI